MVTMIFVGSVMVFFSVIIQGIFSYVGIRFMQVRFLSGQRSMSGALTTFAIALFVVWMFLSAIVDIWAWCMLYRWQGLFEDFETSLYFSTVTFTSLGYGDIVLEPPFRLLSAFEAANGILIFGWTTAVLFAVVRQILLQNSDAPPTGKNTGN